LSTSEKPVVLQNGHQPNKMEYFVKTDSIVRKIWGKSDTILFIFAGAAAEFALNKAVDWLYYTGKLPSDPIGRLFSTVTYARQIVFSEVEEANKAIDSIAAIHQQVEHNRGFKIPDWAYRDVLFMLIDYSIRSFELLERNLTEIEREEVFKVFHKMGLRMHLTGLPENYNQWLSIRQEHLQNNLISSHYTTDLFKQYKKHLGAVRYQILRQVQVLVVPPRVNTLLRLGRLPLFIPVILIYKLSRLVKLDGLIKQLILPSAYKVQIEDLDNMPH